MLFEGKHVYMKDFHSSHLVTAFLQMELWVLTQGRKIHIVRIEHLENHDGWHYHVFYVYQDGKVGGNGNGHHLNSFFAAFIGLRLITRVVGILIGLAGSTGLLI